MNSKLFIVIQGERVMWDFVKGISFSIEREAISDLEMPTDNMVLKQKAVLIFNKGFIGEKRFDYNDSHELIKEFRSMRDVLNEIVTIKEIDVVGEITVRAKMLLIETDDSLQQLRNLEFELEQKDLAFQRSKYILETKEANECEACESKNIIFNEDEGKWYCEDCYQQQLLI